MSRSRNAFQRTPDALDDTSSPGRCPPTDPDHRSLPTSALPPARVSSLVRGISWVYYFDSCRNLLVTAVATECHPRGEGRGTKIPTGNSWTAESTEARQAPREGGS